MNDFLWCVKHGFCFWCGHSISWVSIYKCHSVIHMDWTKKALEELKYKESE
jgi:hypothetical protein